MSYLYRTTPYTSYSHRIHDIPIYTMESSPVDCAALGEMIGRKTTPIHTCRPCTHSSHTQGSGDLIVMMCRVWPNHP